MKRAEEVANELFPRHIDEPESFAEAVGRQAVIDGYEQAEKDLALSWEDIKLIVDIAGNIKPCLRDEQTFHEEVLRRFNEAKKQNIQKK